MSGHNKWSKIKHKKAVEDAKKSKVFSKYARLITVESKRAGGDEDSPGLRAVIEQAKRENMPKDNIERAIKKGLDSDTKNAETITYEAYGPGGVAIVIDCLTDNRNRTAAEIKHLLSLHNLSLSDIGSATWAFEKKGLEWLPKTFIEISPKEKDKLEEVVVNLEDHDDVQKVFTNMKS